nr:cytochrome c oxidase subunit 4 isoform 1, mitochondrial-like [Vanessa tameamea]
MFPIVKSPLIFKPKSQFIRTVYGYWRIGCRDVVGHGINGSANYKDDALFPFPAIRFKENTRDICALREKERGDWRLLCCEEKKELYRASFCQTFAEFKAPTGQWKFIMGWVFICTSFAFWASMFCHYYVFEPLPSSFSKASQKAQLRRMLELRVNPIDGISSMWDYDNDRWKVKKNRIIIPELFM